MLNNYQQEQALESTEPTEASFATIGTVYADGVSLIFDGDTVESTKHYKVNSFVVFSAGDRVRIIKDSGTYVVEYPVGNPRTSFAADTATSATTAATATNATKLNNKNESALSVSTATTATNFTGRHTGSSVGFFNHSAATQWEVNDATGTIASVTTQFNRLLDALQACGLIR